jgi:hypothetical protein
VNLINSPQGTDEGNQGGAFVINGYVDSSQYLDINLTDMTFINNKVSAPLPHPDINSRVGVIRRGHACAVAHGT